MVTLTGYLNTVAHPKHYSGKIECIDCIESAVADLNGFEGFLAGNAIFRFKRKNGKDDLQKAEWYLSKLMEMQEDNEQEDNENE